MDKQYKRLPAAPKKILDINPERDVRVRILGRIIDKADGAIVVDDGSSTATIVAETSLSINDMVMVISRVLPLEEGYELRSEAVLDMNGLDMELYKKIYGDV